MCRIIRGRCSINKTLASNVLCRFAMTAQRTVTIGSYRPNAGVNISRLATKRKGRFAQTNNANGQDARNCKNGIFASGIDSLNGNEEKENEMLRVVVKMDLDEARYWLEALEANLLDADYCVSGDSKTHFKIAALRRVMQRNVETENALFTAYDAIEKVKGILGKVL